MSTARFDGASMKAGPLKGNLTPMRSLFTLLALLLLSACASTGEMNVPVGRFASAVAPTEAEVGAAQESAATPESQGRTPSAPPSTAVADEAGKVRMIRDEPRRFDFPKPPDPAERFRTTDKITLAADKMPARNFVNYVFGELLKVNFVIVDGAPGLDSPVSLSSQVPISSRRLYQLATEMLSSVGLSVIEKEGVFFVGPADSRTGFGLPVGYGRTSADVPNAPGQILQLMPVKFGTNLTLLKALREIAGAEVTFDSRQLAFFVTGTRTSILKVQELLQLFDQPGARSSRVGLISLTFLTPGEFVNEVTKLLANDGVAVGDEQVLSLVPIDRLGAVVVFAAEEAVIERLEFWAKQIDRAGEGPAGRYFVFQPRFSRAADLGTSVAALIGADTSRTAEPSAPRDTRSAVTAGVSAEGPAPSRPRGSVTGVAVTGNGVSMTIDSVSNALIFFTTGPKYEALLPLIRRLDRPPRQVLIEATVAEVTLTGEFARGVEFAFKDGKFTGGTLGSLGLPGGGFALNFAESLTDQIRLRLSQNDSQVNVLSNPILMVRDGFSATIQVGNDVPTVSSTASDPVLSDRTVTSIQYRKTGLNLTIVPTINAEGAVALGITQSITNTVPVSSGVSGAPIFFQRAVSTEVVAASGQGVLIGGLMSESQSESGNRVPFFSRIPIAGEFLSSKTKRREKTELILLITPRIVDSASDWATVYQRLKEGFRYLQLEDQSPAKEPGASVASP